MFESTRDLNQRDEVLISALTRRRDTLEGEMNREPAPPLLVYFAFLEIPRTRGSCRLSFPPLSLLRPFNVHCTVAERGEKEGVRERKPTSFSGLKIKLSIQITNMFFPFASIYLETVVGVIISPERLTIKVSKFPTIVESCL